MKMKQIDGISMDYFHDETDDSQHFACFIATIGLDSPAASLNSVEPLQTCLTTSIKLSLAFCKASISSDSSLPPHKNDCLVIEKGEKTLHIWPIIAN